ncbi:hypothetical protein B0H17DRAFT_1084881 [Mycena rosella]|uniref:DUF6534 domain-containing protein n=1 Tax=Mycena rosella TaxID=1033263 RepID=A0AAD7D0A2_MYCRO|nr:hypothetical protein B0H17DRAFT_1084881 [Mycena rosella]
MSQYSLLTGPILAGTQFNWALLGTLTVQVYIFYLSFPRERAWIKALVYTIFLLDVAQTAIASHFAYALLVNGWGNPEALLKLPWSSVAIPIFTGLISAAVQIFFAWRIYALRGDSRIGAAISALIVLLALMQCFSAIITDSLFAVKTQLSELRRLTVGVKIWLIGSAACDVVITCTMIVILSQYRRKTPWKKTDGLITRLIYNTVENGAVTSIVALVDVVLFLWNPDVYLHEAPTFMLGKIYSNVLLATLNARKRTDEGVSTSATFAESHELQLRTQGSTRKPVPQTVHITTVTEIKSDVSCPCSSHTYAES